MKKKIIFLLFALMMTSWSQAQLSLTVCDGTATNEYVPIYCTNAFTRSQFIYPSSALATMSGSTVNSMTFYLNQVSATFGSASWNVYLTEVASTSIIKFIDASTATQVYSGTVSISNNQMTITFTTPYTYNGGNLLVGFDQTEFGDSFAMWNGVTVNNASISGYSFFSLSLVLATQKNFLPKVTFNYYSADPNYCFMPLNVAVSGIDTTSAIVSWNTGGGETSWNLKWGVEGFLPDSTGMGTLVANLTDSTYTFNNVLTSGTNYDVYIQSVCTATNNYSLWRKISFKTITVPATVPYYTDFSTADNGQWNSSPSLSFNCFFVGSDLLGNACYSSGGALYVSDDEGDTYSYNNEYSSLSYVTRTFTNIAVGDYAISYRWKCAGDGTSDFGRAFLLPADQSVPTIYSNTVPYSWIALDGAAPLSGKSEWQLRNNEFTITTSGDYKLMFLWRNNYFLGTKPPLAIDDLSFTMLTCPSPVSFAANNIDTASVDLSWVEVATATSWEVEYGLTGFAQGTGTSVIVNDTNYTITGLMPNTKYDAYVRALCGSDDNSNWSITSFRTSCLAYASVPYYENFNNVGQGNSEFSRLPSCWDYINTATDSYYQEWPRVNEWNELYFHSYYSPYLTDYGDAYAILPPFNNINTLQLSFMAKKETYEYETYDFDLEIGIMTDPAVDSTFELITTISPTEIYSEYIVYLNEYTGNGKYIAMRLLKPTVNNQSLDGFVDNVAVEYIPSCFKPNDIASVATFPTEVSLAWECDSEAPNYEVQYGPKGFVLGTGTIITGVDTTKTCTISGLTTGVVYDFYVRAMCSATDSSVWAGPLAVTPGEVIINQGTVGSSNESGFCNDFRYSWSQSIYTTQEIASSGIITSLSFDCSASATDVFFDTLRIYVAETAHNTDTSWVPMEDLTMVYEGIGITDLGTTLGWNTIQLEDPYYYSGSENLAVIISKSMSQENCSVYWKFNTALLYSYRKSDSYANYAQHPGTASSSTGNYRPNIKIELASTIGYCQKPGKIEISNIEIFSARANWQVGNEESVWNIKYDTTGFDVETSGTLVNDIDTIFYNITGLTDSTTYDVYVQSQCTDTTVSGWKGPITFTTLPMCAAPTNFRFAGMNDSSVTLAWTPGFTETLWEIEYGTAGFIQGTGIVITDSLTQHQITGLVSGGIYNFYIRSICDSNLQSVWVGPITQIIGDITIGNGLQSYHNLPFAGYFDYSYSQQLFDANEMAGACIITEIKFYCASLPSDTTGAVKIWMGNTDKNEFVNNTDYVNPLELIMVYDMGAGVAWSSLQVGWNTFVLDEPFVYDGTSNLVVAFYEGLPGQSTSSSFYVHTTTAHKSLAHYSDTQSGVSYTSPAAAAIHKIFDFKRNNIKLTAIPVNPNYCFMPIHFEVTEKTTSSFGVSWAPIDSTFACTWNLKWGIHGFDVDTAGILVTGLDSTSYFIDNLQTNTVYDVYVQTVCSSSLSSDWKGPLTVCTLCGATTGIPFVENFDSWPGAISSQNNNLPICWDYINNGHFSYYAGYPLVYTTTASYSGSNCIYFEVKDYASYEDQYAILPPFDNISDLRIQFYGKRKPSPYFYNYYSGILVVGIMDSVSESAFVPYDTINLTETYEKYAVYLSQYAGTGNRIVLKAPKTTVLDNVFYLDNILVDTIPACPSVSYIAITAVDTTSATLTWFENGDATAWEIEYGEVGYTQGTGTVLAANTNPFTVTGLIPGTRYDVYVKAACGSTWEGPRCFYTPATVPYSCGFEANETETSKWILENGDMINQWWIGPDYCNFGHYSGTQGLFVSYDGGQSNYYTNQNTSIYAYTTMYLEAGTYIASFKWICKGDGSSDYIRAFLVPDSVSLIADQNFGINSTNTPDGWIAISVALKNQSTWQSFLNGNVAVETAGKYNLVFSWFNNASVSKFPAPAIDEVQFYAVTCAAPTALQCTSSDMSSATITWTDEATPASWNIEYGVKGFVRDSGTFVTTTTKPYVITNLQAATQYDVYVQANCGEEDGLSLWTGPFTFNTTPCVESDKCPITIKMFDLLCDGWSGDAIEVYVVNGASEILVGSYTMVSGSNAVQQALLCPGTLSFRWKAGLFPNECSFILLNQEGDSIYSCADGSTLQDGAEFLSYNSCGVPSCSAPSGLVASLGAVTFNNAAVDLTWTATVNALTYNVLRDGIKVAVNRTTTNYTDHVNANGNYVYTVTASCAEGLESNPSNLSTIVVTGVGIGENAAEQARIYPNPTNDKVKIEAAKMTRISVMNVIGQMLYEEEVDTDAYEFGFAGYETGVYMIRIETTTGSATKRVTVVK